MEISKPFVAVLLLRSLYAANFLLCKAAFDAGMNPFVFVFYAQAAATISLAPIAIFFHWRTAPRLPFSVLIKTFMLSLVGITASSDILGVALKYTTASLAAATINTVPIVTFFLAVLFRMEKVKLRTSPGIMKITGLALCLAGATIIASYRGPFLKLLLHHHLVKYHPQQLRGHVTYTSRTWIKGVSFMLLFNLTIAFLLVLQGRLLKYFPSKLLFTTLQCIMSSIQSFIVAIAFVRDFKQWKLGWNAKLLSVIYCGVVVTGGAFYLLTWIIEKKGPVYLAMTTPLTLVFTILASTFLFGEVISLGSILGALLLVGGLYCVLLGKVKEEETEKRLRTVIVDCANRAYEEPKEELTT